MIRIRRQTLVPGLGLALAVVLAFVVTRGSARRPEAALREAASAYATALAEGDAASAARWRADRDPEPEVRRAQALRGVFWAVREIDHPESEDEASVTVLWVGADGRQQAERQLWALDGAGRWAFVALAQ